MKMKKFINNPENLTPELLEGLVLASKDLVSLGESRMVIDNKLAQADRVTIMTRGGPSHEPAINGFVGEDMVDVSVMGDVFATPGPQTYLDAIKLANRGKGVLCIVLNHARGMLTGNLTMKECAKEDLNVIEVVTREDITDAPRSNADDKRSLVGCISTYKIAGAIAAEDKSLEEVATAAQHFADNMVTLAVAASSTIHPTTGDLLANLSEDEMKIGMGQHGEGGEGRQPMKSADEAAAIVLGGLIADLDIKEGEKAMLILNGTGATALMELFIIYRRYVEYLRNKNIEIVVNHVDELLTIQEQAGFQMFMARMDDELLHYWNVPCSTPYMKK